MGIVTVRCVAAMLATNSEYIALFPCFLLSILRSLTCAKPGLRSWVLSLEGKVLRTSDLMLHNDLSQTTSDIYALALWMLHPPTKMHARPWLPPLNFTCLIRPNASNILCWTTVKCFHCSLQVRPLATTLQPLHGQTLSQAVLCGYTLWAWQPVLASGHHTSQ